MCDFTNCPVCGKRYRRHDSGRRGAFCSDLCQNSVPFPRRPQIRWQDVERVIGMYTTQKRAAEALGVSYVRFRRFVQSEGLRQHFPALGGAATWAG